MNFDALNRIQKLYFGYEEISRVTGVSLPSARVTACRYVKYNLLVRVKRGVYMLRKKWESMSREEEFIIANIIQTPSYVSLFSALGYYELTTQVQRRYVESIGLNRSLEKEVEAGSFLYFKIRKDFYREFIREKDFFIATPEKAFVDSLYLKSLGCYNFDISSVDLSGLNRERIAKIVESLPEKTQRRVKANGYF